AVVTDGALKDVAFVTEHLFYVGTNSGITKCHWESGQTFSNEKLTGLSYRIYALEFNSRDKLLYAATSNGLYCIDSTGANRLINYQGENIYPNDLFYENGKIYVCDKLNGILILEKGMVSTTIQPIVNGKVVVLTKMIIHNEMVLAKSADGLYEFDLHGKMIMSIPALFGFSSKRVIDFTFDKTGLWVSHSGGVQQIDLNYLHQKKTVPQIQIKKIFVNEEGKSLGEIGDFNSEQRKIQFVLYSAGLRNRELLRYYYKLEGYDADWNSNNFESNEIMYNALAPGNYTLFVKAEKQGVFSDIVSYSFSIAQPFYARWWFIAASIVLFLIMVFFVYQTQLNRQRKKSQQLQELNASRLTAIQSQMNPHFIFNALNSIQDLVLKGDVENSYFYITKFSNLVRRTLNYSEKDFIDFDQEIKLLELYLSLEKLRFKKDFAYQIETQNAQDIQLPPLLIQPFIENALVHGLLHKEGARTLKITFELKELLFCTIEDNGVGREKAKAIKQRQKSEHESFSGKAIHRRFEILGNVLGGNFGYHYEDLMENGVPSGTKVILRIPVKHKF
ncbi:MAG: histidine kinase, partial [Bacteroidota bacterium]|nr:histidine kinase [Bacteroidota bacterium]